MKNASRDQFDKEFDSMNASWGYENADISDEGKELIYKMINGQLTEDEFNEAVRKMK
ncbi:hypothetical protein [Paenibacillus agilis]|uniref:hypothetical protein n=1 Tax=Paenibacillus agilis TaxID=3020863 RepID=UPI0016497A68|nr:hypothetical protein [Paenibacillus agilis]